MKSTTLKNKVQHLEKQYENAVPDHVKGNSPIGNKFIYAIFVPFLKLPYMVLYET